MTQKVCIRSSFRVAAIACSVTLLFGCTQGENTKVEPSTKAEPATSAAPALANNSQQASKEFEEQLPQDLRSAKVVQGGICPVDWVNRQTVKSDLGIKKSDPFGIEGWAATDTKERPVPPEAVIALHGDSKYYLRAERFQRPDLAKRDPLLALAGYRAEGYLHQVKPGKYNIFIMQGDQGTLIACRTSISLAIN